MIVKEVASLVIIAVMSTVFVMKIIEDMTTDDEKVESVCVEYFDDNDRKVKECEFREIRKHD